MIKLYAKKGSELEQTLKAMHESIKKSEAAARRIIKDATGVEPDSIGYRWGFGNIVCFSPTCVKFKQEDWDKIDEKVMRRDKRDDDYFKPNRRYKAGNQIFDKFAEEVEIIKDEPLKKHGIHTMFEYQSFWVQPAHVIEGDIYFLFASDSLPHGFTDKAKNEAEREFTIEY